MMTNRIRTYPTMLVIALLGAAAAAEPAGRSVDLETCVQMALERNPITRSAREGVAAAEAEVGAARAAYYPELTANAGYSRWERHAYLPSGIIQPGISSTIGPTDDWYSGVSARYTVFDSGRRWAELQTAKALTEAAVEDQARVEQNLVFAVERSYYQLAAALEIEAAALRAAGRAEAHLNLARTRKQVGAVPQVDVMRAQVETANARLAVQRAENMVRIARAELNTAIGLPVESELDIDRRPPPLSSPDSFQLAAAIKHALEARPDVRAARRKVEASRMGVSAARSASGPQIAGEARFGWRDAGFVPEDKDWLVGFSIELPLFDGFRRKRKLDGARAMLSREEAELERLTQEVRRQVWTTHSRLRESHAVLESTEALVADAGESLRLADERYRAGAGTIADLLDSETAMARAEASRSAAEWNYQAAVAELRYVTAAKGDAKGVTAFLSDFGLSGRLGEINVPLCSAGCSR